MDCSPPGSSVHGILQARILEWVAMSFSRRSSRPRDWSLDSPVSCVSRWALHYWRHLGNPLVWWCRAVLCLVSQSCPTLCGPRDCSPPGSSVHGILQARVLEWVVTSSSRGSSQPRGQTHISCISADSLLSEPPGKPLTALLTKVSQNFSKFSVNPDHLGILLKYRFCFGARPEILH